MRGEGESRLEMRGDGKSRLDGMDRGEVIRYLL